MFIHPNLQGAVSQAARGESAGGAAAGSRQAPVGGSASRRRGRLVGQQGRRTVRLTHTLLSRQFCKHNLT